MKMCLTYSEVNQIIVDYLASQGKIEKKETSVTWEVDRWEVKEPTVIIEQ